MRVPSGAFGLSLALGANAAIVSVPSTCEAGTVTVTVVVTETPTATAAASVPLVTTLVETVTQASTATDFVTIEASSSVVSSAQVGESQVSSSGTSRYSTYSGPYGTTILTTAIVSPVPSYPAPKVLSELSDGQPQNPTGASPPSSLVSSIGALSSSVSPIGSSTSSSATPTVLSEASEGQPEVTATPFASSSPVSVAGSSTNAFSTLSVNGSMGLGYTGPASGATMTTSAAFVQTSSSLTIISSTISVSSSGSASSYVFSSPALPSYSQTAGSSSTIGTSTISNATSSPAALSSALTSFASRAPTFPFSKPAIANSTTTISAPSTSVVESSSSVVPTYNFSSAAALSSSSEAPKIPSYVFTTPAVAQSSSSAVPSYAFNASAVGTSSSLTASLSTVSALSPNSTVKMPQPTYPTSQASLSSVAAASPSISVPAFNTSSAAAVASSLASTSSSTALPPYPWSGPSSSASVSASLSQPVFNTSLAAAVASSLATSSSSSTKMLPSYPWSGPSSSAGVSASVSPPAFNTSSAAAVTSSLASSSSLRVPLSYPVTVHWPTASTSSNAVALISSSGASKGETSKKSRASKSSANSSSSGVATSTMQSSSSLEINSSAQAGWTTSTSVILPSETPKAKSCSHHRESSTSASSSVTAIFSEPTYPAPTWLAPSRTWGLNSADGIATPFSLPPKEVKIDPIQPRWVAETSEESECEAETSTSEAFPMPTTLPGVPHPQSYNFSRPTTLAPSTLQTSSAQPSLSTSMYSGLPPVVNTTSHAATPTALGYPWSGTATGCAPGATSTGRESSWLNITFDDVSPPIQPPQYPNDFSPMFTPYHQLDWADGFALVSNTTSNISFVPRSPPNMAMYIVDSDDNPHSENKSLNGAFGALDPLRWNSSAFQFDVYSGYFGCNYQGSSKCQWQALGYQLDSNHWPHPMINETFTTRPYGGNHSALDFHSFSDNFKNLTALHITVSVQENGTTTKVGWYMDDLMAQWTDKSCVATAERQQTPDITG